MSTVEATGKREANLGSAQLAEIISSLEIACFESHFPNLVASFYFSLFPFFPVLWGHTLIATPPLVG